MECKHEWFEDKGKVLGKSCPKCDCLLINYTNPATNEKSKVVYKMSNPSVGIYNWSGE